jgi:putative addiction module CopG family antidote
MNLTLKPELESFIQQEILAGKYSTPDEAIEAALNLLQSQNSVDRFATELRDKIDVAAAQLDSAEPTLRERGEGLNGDDVIASLRANNWVKGQRVDNGRYKIICQLGMGEFGTIYKAIDKRMGIKWHLFVSIETITEKYHDRVDFEQFQEELCNETQNVNYYSSHLLAVNRVFFEGKTWAIVTTNIEDESLEDYIVDRGILTEDEATKIIQKIGYAVSYDRLNRLRHREISPSNIMISRWWGTPTLIDFGLSELVVDTAKNINSESPFYLAPEKTEYCGDSQYIYALAATLYTCITGNIPPLSKMRMIQDSLIPPQQLNPQISDKINRVILTGMALKLTDRSSSLEDWLSLIPPLKLDEQELLDAFRRGQRTFCKLDMSNMQLPNASLYSINLVDINFNHSNCKHANFSKSKFERVDFSNLVFRNAILSKASFTNTNLQNTDLRGAYLDDADFNDTNLQGANLCGANLRGAKILKEQLKQAKTNFWTIFPNGKRGGWW